MKVLTFTIPLLLAANSRRLDGVTQSREDSSSFLELDRQKRFVKEIFVKVKN